MRLALAAIACAIFPLSAHAQDVQGEDIMRPLTVSIAGPCALGAGGRDSDCAGVAYHAFPSSGRIDFTARLGPQSVAFSGEADENENGAYTLHLDSVMAPGLGRVEAEGDCEMQVGKDGRSVSSITCQAQTDDGVFTLQASGPVAAADPGDADLDGELDDTGYDA